MKLELWDGRRDDDQDLITQTVGISLLLLTGCEASRNMRDNSRRWRSWRGNGEKFCAAMFADRPALSTLVMRPSGACNGRPLFQREAG